MPFLIRRARDGRGSRFISASAISAAIACLGLPAVAQTTAPASSSNPAPPATLREVTITANPLGTGELIAPVEASGGTGLLLRSQTTLGETLSGLPGVSSTYFGPNASRPVIRGLDGDRIRILSNGAELADASGLSYDHAVTADPLSLERVEVLRGPAALLYGGSAIGGVVNLIDNRIPREPIRGISGRADLAGATGNRERSAAALLEGGNGRIGLHVDAFDRRTGEVAAPIAIACTQGGVTTVARRICNSEAHARGAAVGGTAFFDAGYLGASFASQRNTYGVVAEDEVTIGMRSDRAALEGLWRDPLPGLRSLKLLGSSTDYAHTEFDAGVPATEFRRRNNDLRLEARHAPLGPLQGVLGLQLDRGSFSAVGAEAFAPFSRTRGAALFLYEELPTAWGKLSGGVRREQVQVDSDGNPLLARFTPGSRSFGPTSASLGALWNLAPTWQLTGNLARSQRAPREVELYADGPHAATGSYEVGNRNVGLERATSLDVGVQWKDGANIVKLSAFRSRFSSYLALLSTGIARDGDGNGAVVGVNDCGDGNSVESGCTAAVLPEFAYTAVAARFQGLEASGNIRLANGGDGENGRLDLGWRADLVRADNLTLGQPLPRIAPARVGATLDWAHGPWGLRAGFDHYAAQSRVPVGELATAGYMLWNAAATWRAKAGRTSLLWYARLDNITDRLAYSASSVLTQTIPGRAPLPGRSLKLGLRADF